MGAIIQFDLFEPRPKELDFLKADIKAVNESCDKVRRKLFAENSILKKKCYDLEERLQVIERNLCKGTNNA